MAMDNPIESKAGGGKVRGNIVTILQVLRLTRLCIVLFVRIFFSRWHWEAIKWSMLHGDEA